MASRIAPAPPRSAAAPNSRRQTTRPGGRPCATSAHLILGNSSRTPPAVGHKHPHGPSMHADKRQASLRPFRVEIVRRDDPLAIVLDLHRCDFLPRRAPVVWAGMAQLAIRCKGIPQKEGLIVPQANKCEAAGCDSGGNRGLPHSGKEKSRAPATGTFGGARLCVTQQARGWICLYLRVAPAALLSTSAAPFTQL